MKILVFDNYDSFTYNLVQLVEKITHARVDVFRNDQIALEAIEAYGKIILSPGPGIPEEAGLLLPVINRYASTKSILGVCLGHQAISLAFGGKLENLSTVYHGVATDIHIGNPSNSTDASQAANTVRSPLFNGLPDRIVVGRYHSWIVSDEQFPEVL